MLVLTRKKDEKIMIGEDIVITIVEVDNNKVKLGIDAPKEIEILREEVYKEVETENKDAIASDVLNVDKLLQISNVKGEEKKREK
ncbi:carbon storage regulator CsrA [Natronospora cellulosivora (SeqCode)]